MPKPEASELSFRDLFNSLRTVQGERPLWPALIGKMLDEKFLKQRSVDEGYKAEVAISRINHKWRAGNNERNLVQQLYHNAVEACDGSVVVDKEPLWLLGYEWPNQGGATEKGRRADLVGLKTDGSLVVFEAKRVDSGDAPWKAILEGLDYLACLLRPKNFSRITNAVAKWQKVDSNHPVPDAFKRVNPNIDRRPTLVVLAPPEYFHERHIEGIRGKDWPEIARIAESFVPSVRIQFVTTDFESQQLKSVKIPPR